MIKTIQHTCKIPISNSSLKFKGEYVCTEEVLKFNDGELEDAVVCHCDQDKCNNKTPVSASNVIVVQYFGIIYGCMFLLISSFLWV
jgi:hypothetical protein